MPECQRGGQLLTPPSVPHSLRRLSGLALGDHQQLSLLLRAGAESVIPPQRRGPLGDERSRSRNGRFIGSGDSGREVSADRVGGPPILATRLVPVPELVWPSRQPRFDLAKALHWSGCSSCSAPRLDGVLRGQRTWSPTRPTRRRTFVRSHFGCSIVRVVRRTGEAASLRSAGQFMVLLATWFAPFCVWHRRGGR